MRAEAESHGGPDFAVFFQTRLRSLLAACRVPCRFGRCESVACRLPVCWNTALCEALYPSLHGVEITLRNIIDSRVRTLHGDLWFDKPGALKLPHQMESLARVRVRLQKRHEPETHDRIVSELGFGFWTGMLDPLYDKDLWRSGAALAFHGAPRNKRARAVLLARVNGIRQLRNHASHHDVLWKRAQLADGTLRDGDSRDGSAQQCSRPFGLSIGSRRSWPRVRCRSRLISTPSHRTGFPNGERQRPRRRNRGRSWRLSGVLPPVPLPQLSRTVLG